MKAPNFYLTDWLENKTFKFSDSYQIRIVDSEPVIFPVKRDVVFTKEDLSSFEMGSSVSSKNRNYQTISIPVLRGVEVALPSYQPAEREFRCGNTIRTLFGPTVESPEPLKITIEEDERLLARKIIQYCILKTSPNEYNNLRRDSYSPYRYIDEIEVSVLDNSLNEVVLIYFFKYCKLIGYDYGEAFSYDSNSLLTASLTFSYLESGIKF